MRGSQVLLAVVVVSASALTVLAAPVAAETQSTRIAIVNGIPGTKVDICINGKEVRSKLPYARVTAKTQPAARKTIKVFKKDPRKCRGRLLARRVIHPLAGDDVTLVVTRTRPKLVHFTNRMPRFFPYLMWRHAGDMGPVVLRYDSWLQVEDGRVIEPAGAVRAWTKGDEYRVDWAAGASFRLEASWPDRDWPIARSAIVAYDPARSVEWLLVGKNAKTARFVLIRRAVIDP
jgi:hypothetical protein